MPGFSGLQTDFWTWLILAVVTACWLFSLRIAPGWRAEGWPALLKSLFGFVWLSFGLDIVLRFLMLAYNAVEWGNQTVRLVTLPAETVNASLAYCGLFWLGISLAYSVAARRISAGPLVWTEVFTLEMIYAAAIPMALVCSAVFYLVDTPNVVPESVITPLVTLAFFYIVSATVVWWDFFRHGEPIWRVGGVHVIVLLPALMHGWRSPYRENLAPLFLIPLVAALFAGRRLKLWKALPVGVLCFLVVSGLVSSYRRIKWENVRPEEVTAEIRRDGVVSWFAGDFGERLSRFHSFDSILLTVHLVPRTVKYSGQSVLVAPIVRGLVPRFIYGNKAAADAGEKFGQTIWSYNDPLMRDHGGAAIAPSMPGDLYHSGGALDVALGALMWGGLIGLVDGWKRYLPVYCAAAITTLLATHCAMSIERDFDHEVAGLLQTLLLFVVVAGVVALARRRRPVGEFEGVGAGIGVGAVRERYPSLGRG